MAQRAQRYGTIVVVGGGCYGSYYVRQLQRAASAGVLSCERLLVVDRDPECRVAVDAAAASREPRPDVVVQEWPAFFRSYFAEAARAGDPLADAIVPSPLMPHLMFGWLVQRARDRWPERMVAQRPLDRAPSIPWQQAAPDGTHYVSFAEWTCPINCIEPAKCPAIRGPRTWSMPPALDAYVAEERARGHDLAGPVVFHCRHRAYGVGMFDTCDVLAADRLVAETAACAAARVLVGTVSHCHGAWSVLQVGAPTEHEAVAHATRN
jgi:hypothetical protein